LALQRVDRFVGFSRDQAEAGAEGSELGHSVRRDGGLFIITLTSYSDTQLAM